MRFMILLSVCVACAMSMTVRAQEPEGPAALLEDWKDAARDRTIPIKIDYAKTIDKPTPVVIISHGLGGSREGLAYIGQYWAEHGYVAVHLQHPGSDSTLWKGLPPGAGMQAMKKGMTVEQFSARIEDVKFALDELKRRNDDPSWALHGKLNLDQIAMAGHSFGAITTQAMCGETFPNGKSFFDPRIKVGIAFSPSPPPGGDSKTAFASITIPIFYWTGTNDTAPSTISSLKAIQRREPFDATAKNDAYLVILTDGDHMVFNGRLTEQPDERPNDTVWHDLIEKGTTAFLDKYLKRDAAQGKYLDDGAFAKEIEPKGTYEMKKGEGK